MAFSDYHNKAKTTNQDYVKGKEAKKLSNY